MAGEINEAMIKTRDILFEHFDEQVLEKVRTESTNARDRYERMFMDLTRVELKDHADFDGDNGFILTSLPSPSLRDHVPLGRYELPRRSGEAHLYRLGHPLGEFVLDQAKSHRLPPARLVFDYEAYPLRLTTLEPVRGAKGWLAVELLTVESLGGNEQHLVISAVTDDGSVLPEDDPEKLLRLPVRERLELKALSDDNPLLHADLAERKKRLAENINRRNLSYFDQEVQKLDAWADDLKIGLEQEIREMDRQIKEVRRTATVAPTLEEKLHWQKQQRELEKKRNKLRRELFDRQDEVEERRNAFISELEAQLKQKVEERMLYIIEWELM